MSKERKKPEMGLKKAPVTAAKIQVNASGKTGKPTGRNKPPKFGGK